MNEKRLLIALGALSVALTACGASEINDPGADPMGTGGSTVTPGAGAGGGSGAVPNANSGGITSSTSGGAPGGTAGGSPTAGSSSGGALPVGPCMPGIPVTTQIPKLANFQYENAVRDLLGVTALEGKPVSQSLYGDFDGAMTAPAWTIYQEVAGKIAAQVMASPTSKALFINCDPAAAGCLKTTIETFGRKAFRRKLSAEEVASFETLSKTTPPGTPAEVAEAILTAFLVSPSFLLIPELNVQAEGSAIKLSSHEVAARLSFLLWGSIPDDMLNAAADADQLQTKEQILAQAQRMVQVRAKAGPMMSAFHREWAQMNNGSGHWWKGDHDPAKFPSYKATTKPAYQAELDAFFEEVSATGTFQDLLLSNVAYVNKDNAETYGLDPAQYGAQLTKVTLDPAQNRPGFLTRAGFLSSYANYDATSPILRGAFISVWMLAINVPPPNPEFAKATVAGTFPTQRAYVEALTEKPGSDCSGCHALINPAGYVLERFDAIGKTQTKDLRGGTIDASVTTATVQFGDNVSKPITSPLEMMQEIAKSPRAHELYAKAWVSHAYGRPSNANDQCIVDGLKTKLAGTYTILNLLADLTQADSFRLRVRGTP